MRVMVTGAAGQLGSTIVQVFHGRADIVGVDRRSLDITDVTSVLRRVRAERPDVIINCAAYNAVDAAEDDPQVALAGNAFGVLALARAAAEVDATLVHYSTDFVFDGRATEPYSEEDSPNPESTYGASKLLGEWFGADAPAHYVLRVESLFGGTHRRSSIDRILDAIVEGKPARVFVDRHVTPSYVVDVAGATWMLLEMRAAYGLYHCVNTGITTWKGLADHARRLLGGSAEIVGIKTSDVNMRAPRPRYCALANDKLQQAGIDMPSWEDALERYVASLTMS
jgi:dTDP-4-dehydrorhamnose reductase